MAEEQQIPIQVNTTVLALTNLGLVFDEEHFVLQLTSGNQMTRYLVTPKHAKRILMLLQRELEKHEDKFGKLDAKLPEKGSAPEKRMGF